MPLPALHLVLGDEELLVERAVRASLDAARADDPTAELTTRNAADLTESILLELVSPSLFSASRVIALEAAQEIGHDAADAVIAYAADPTDRVVLVVQHKGGGRSKAAKALPAALRNAGAVVTDCAKITRPADREAFVRAEIRNAGGRVAGDAVAALIEAVGTDLRELAAASGQLVADSGGTVDEDAVRRYHRGRADVTGFAVAEKVVAGNEAAALETLRSAEQIGVPHVLVADALADAVRTIARVSAAGSAHPRQLAAELGMPPWKARKALGQARGWRPAALTEALGVVATLNAEVKGAADDANYALHRAVRQLAALRTRR